MKIILPYPDPKLSPNARVHWGSVSGKKKKARQDATWATLAAEGFHDFEAPADGPIPMRVTFFPPDARKRDDDNAIGAFKHARDGIADSLGVDDSRFSASYHFGAPEKPGRVEVEL
jgi:crossover junction endodeoxyribonuclease RusA